MLTPVGTAMLFRAFPPAERAKASAVLLIPAILAPALGPVIGGWLVTDVSWRLIFFVNLPVGVAGLIFGALFLKENKEPSAGRFDGQAALRAARLHGFHDAFLAATVLSIFAALSALMIRNEDAVASLPSSFGNQHDEAVGAVMVSRRSEDSMVRPT